MDATQRPATGTGRRVLVVDDDPDCATVLRILLRREGFDARTASDGHEALAKAADFLPDVVLLDLTLPGMSGEEVAAELRKNGATAGALVVAVSGYGDQPRPPGFDHAIVKPVDHDTLLKLLHAHPCNPRNLSPDRDGSAA